MTKRWTMRKYEGDDMYSWAVFRDGRPYTTGCTKEEASWIKKREERKEQ